MEKRKIIARVMYQEGVDEPSPDTWRDWVRIWYPGCGWSISEVAPEGVKCKVCWDNQLCIECWGDYPDRCPECQELGTNGKCLCVAKM